MKPLSSTTSPLQEFICVDATGTSSFVVVSTRAARARAGNESKANEIVAESLAAVNEFLILWNIFFSKSGLVNPDHHVRGRRRDVCGSLTVELHLACGFSSPVGVAAAGKAGFRARKSTHCLPRPSLSF